MARNSQSKSKSKPNSLVTYTNQKENNNTIRNDGTKTSSDGSVVENNALNTGLDLNEQSNHVEMDNIRQGRNVNEETITHETLQFTEEDVQEEKVYWEQAIYGFILGGNPPWDVMEGFIHRIWGKFNIDKVSFLPNGVFLVRFKDNKSKEEVLNIGNYTFDSKPVIIRQGREDVELQKEDVKVVPAWIRLKGIPLKFWGKCLPRIANLVGKYVKSDSMTDNRTMLGYARVMVELQIDKKYPDKVIFLDEKGKEIEVLVEYEWKPVFCKHCKGYGHQETICRKKPTENHNKAKPKQVWKSVRRINNKTMHVVEKQPDPVEVQIVQETTPNVQPIMLQSGHTPAQQIMRLNKQTVTTMQGGGINAGGQSFLDVLNGTTPPRVGIGQEQTSHPPNQ